MMPNKSAVSGTDVKTVISQVKQAILEAERRQIYDPAILEIESLNLTLKTLVETDEGGGFKITIPIINLQFSAGVGLKQQEMQTISMTLKPPEVTPAKSISSSPAFQSSLVDAIVMIREGVTAASLGKPEFELDDATVGLNFVVGSSGQIEVVLKGSYNIEMTNALELKLHKKKI